MKKPQELTSYNLPDNVYVPDGYYVTEIPECTTANFNRLLEDYNNLVEVVNLLADKAGLEFEEDE